MLSMIGRKPSKSLLPKFRVYFSKLASIERDEYQTQWSMEEEEY